MKKTLLLLVTLLASLSAWADVEITEDNFPDANFRDWLLSQSYGSDSVLTNEEIAGITGINVAVRLIADLKGIEYFTALRTLDCQGNQLTALDVSHNTALTTLDCSSNQLTTLDVSHNTALTTLNCSSNQLTTLDVSNNTALKRLYCNYNQLTTLDVSNKPDLTIINCYNNRLTSLNVSNCAVLRSIDFYCNQISGEAMDNLVASLPSRLGDFQGLFRVAYLTTEDEHNVITNTQVAAARAKNWRVQAWMPQWQDYDGVGVAVSGVEDINAAQPRSGQRYNLMGQPVGKDYKGVVVEDGQKRVIK